jgi:hypothetical protein
VGRTALYMLLAIKRRVRAVHGRDARPKPTSMNMNYTVCTNRVHGGDERGGHTGNQYGVSVVSTACDREGPFNCFERIFAAQPFLHCPLCVILITWFPPSLECNRLEESEVNRSIVLVIY